MKAIIALAIQTAVREQVVDAYKAWKDHSVTTEEFSTWMHDIGITSLAIVYSLTRLGALDEDDEARLETFIRNLTRSYFYF